MGRSNLNIETAREKDLINGLNSPYRVHRVSYINTKAFLKVFTLLSLLFSTPRLWRRMILDIRHYISSTRNIERLDIYVWSSVGLYNLILTSDFLFYYLFDFIKLPKSTGLVSNLRRGMWNLLTVFLLYKSIISSGKSSHLKMRNSSMIPLNGFSFFELPRFAHFHCACVPLFGSGTADRFGMVASFSSFERTPFI